MEVATISCTFPSPMRTLAPSTALRSVSSKRATVSAFSSSSSTSPPPLSLKSSLSSSSLTPSYLGAGDFSGHKLRPAPLDPASVKRNVIAMVIPYVRGTAWEQPPPDLASYLFKSRIVYLGMCLIPAVTELIMAEFLYLQYEDVEKPIFLYINSTGTTKGERKVGYESEAFTIYDAMGFVEAPIFTLCVGNAWGEAALLLAAGAKGNRSALPSSTIMIRQPIGRFQGQATAIEIARNEIKEMKQTLVGLYAKTTGKTEKEIEDDIRRPKYFSPSEAVDYGIIDKVLYNDRATKDRGVLSNMKTSNLI